MTMDEMIAFCGITCSKCPTFLATQNDDSSERKDVAEKWSKEYKSDIKTEDFLSFFFSTLLNIELIHKNPIFQYFIYISKIIRN